MKKSQIAAQMYTLRDFLKTPSDIADSLKKVRKIGFEAVQLSGLGPIDDQELATILAGEGLFCCATHEKAVDIVERTQMVIEHLQRLGCRHTAYPFPHEKPTNYAEAVRLAEKINAAAETMAAAGITLSYHNHAHEFERFDGHIWLDILYDHAPALRAELDTFWVQAGGCNPAAWIKKFPGRQPLLHLKDFGIIQGERAMRPIGQGNLNWSEIIAAGEAAGVEYFIIEQDVCQKSPFDSLSDSLAFLTEHFVR